MDSVFLWRNVLVVLGVFCAGADGVSMLVKEGDSVTLDTGVKADQQVTIRWFFNNTRIAEISGDFSKICTDVQCKDGDERFRDRLELDHQTGSLTITNTRTTDSGDYYLDIIKSGSDIEKMFSVTVDDVATQRDEMKETQVNEKSGLSSAAAAAICAGALLTVAVLLV